MVGWGARQVFMAQPIGREPGRPIRLRYVIDRAPELPELSPKTTSIVYLPRGRSKRNTPLSFVRSTGR